MASTPPKIRIGAPVDRLEADGSYTRVTTKYATDVVNGQTEVVFAINEEPNFDLSGWTQQQLAEQADLQAKLDAVTAVIATVDPAIVAALSAAGPADKVAP
jgi:hypothetical protein